MAMNAIAFRPPMLNTTLSAFRNACAPLTILSQFIATTNAAATTARSFSIFSELPTRSANFTKPFLIAFSPCISLSKPLTITLARAWLILKVWFMSSTQNPHLFRMCCKASDIVKFRSPNAASISPAELSMASRIVSADTCPASAMAYNPSSVTPMLLASWLMNAGELCASDCNDEDEISAPDASFAKLLAIAEICESVYPAVFPNFARYSENSVACSSGKTSSFAFFSAVTASAIAPYPMRLSLAASRIASETSLSSSPWSVAALIFWVIVPNSSAMELREASEMPIPIVPSTFVAVLLIWFMVWLTALTLASSTLNPILFINSDTVTQLTSYP